MVSTPAIFLCQAGDRMKPMCAYCGVATFLCYEFHVQLPRHLDPRAACYSEILPLSMHVSGHSQSASTRRHRQCRKERWQRPLESFRQGMPDSGTEFPQPDLAMIACLGSGDRFLKRYVSSVPAING